MPGTLELLDVMDFKADVLPSAASTNPFDDSAAVFIFKSFLGIECRFPRRFGFEHGVEDDQELAHAGGEDDFGLFAILGESLSEGFDGGVMVFGDQSGHVDHVANGGSSTADVACALVLATVVVERSDSDQRRDLLAVEFSQFRQLGQERGGRDASQAGRALQQFRLGPPVVVRVDQLGNGVIEFLDLAIEHVEDGLQALPRGLGGGLVEPIGFHRAQIQDLPATLDQFGEFLLLFGHFAEQTRLHMLGEPREDSRASILSVLARIPTPTA